MHAIARSGCISAGFGAAISGYLGRQLPALQGRFVRSVKKLLKAAAAQYAIQTSLELARHDP
eukprot:4832743-Amphidinium_carterae.1